MALLILHSPTAMRLSILPAYIIAYAGLSLAQDLTRDAPIRTIQLSARQGNVVQRRISRRQNLPLANYFLGTDLQVGQGH